MPTPSASLVLNVDVTDSDPPWHIIRVPKADVAHFGFKGNLRRVVCSLNGEKPYQCSLFPSMGDYFITLNKKQRDKLDLSIGDAVEVRLEKDESQFGMPMPEEFAEVLKQDVEGERLFSALSPGDQRLMLKLVDFVKGVDLRITRSLVAVELLKQMNGEFVYRIQHDAMKAATSTRPSVVFRK